MSKAMEHSFRVRYAETDQMGWVYHSHYLTWFEVGRTEYMRSRGVPYREIEKRGLQLPLVKADMRLKHPARYDDSLVVRTDVASIASRQVVFTYNVMRDGLSLATGSTTHLCLDAKVDHAISLPDWLRTCLLGVADMQHGD